MVNMFQRGHAIDYGQEYHGKMSTVDQRKYQIQNIKQVAFSYYLCSRND